MLRASKVALQFAVRWPGLADPSIRTLCSERAQADLPPCRLSLAGAWEAFQQSRVDLNRPEVPAREHTSHKRLRRLAGRGQVPPYDRFPGAAAGQAGAC